MTRTYKTKMRNAINGWQATLISIGCRVRGGSLGSRKHLPDQQKNWQAVRGQHFIDKNAISSSLDHFCGNEDTSNFRKPGAQIPPPPIFCVSEQFSHVHNRKLVTLKKNSHP